MNSGEAAAIRAVHSRRLQAESLSAVLSGTEERINQLISEHKFSEVLADREIKKLDQYRISLLAEGKSSVLIGKISKLKLKATYCQIKVNLENKVSAEHEKADYLLFELKKLYNNYSQTQVRDSVIEMIYLELVPEASQNLLSPESLYSEQQNSDTEQAKAEEKISKKSKRVSFNNTVAVKLFKPRGFGIGSSDDEALLEPESIKTLNIESDECSDSKKHVGSLREDNDAMLVEPEIVLAQEVEPSLKADGKDEPCVLPGHDKARFGIYSEVMNRPLNNSANQLGHLSAGVYLQQAKQFQSQISLLTSQQTETIENTDQIVILQLLVKGFCDIAIMAAKEQYARCHKASENAVKALVQARKQLPKSEPVLRDSLGGMNTVASTSNHIEKGGETDERPTGKAETDDERSLGQVSRLEVLTAETAEKEVGALTQYVNLMIGLYPSGLRWSYSSQCLLKTLLSDAIKHFSDEQIDNNSSNKFLEKIQESYRRAYKILFYHFKNGDYQLVVTHAHNFRELTEKLGNSGYKKTFEKIPAVVEYRELTKIIEALAYCKLASEAVQPGSDRGELTLKQKNQAKEYFKLAVQALKELKQIEGFPQTTAIKQYANTVLVPEIKRQLKSPDTGLSLRSTEIFDDDIKSNIADISRAKNSDGSPGHDRDRGTIDLGSMPLMLETSDETVPGVIKKVFRELEISWQDFCVEIARTESSPQRNSRTSQLLNKLSPSRRSCERLKGLLGIGKGSNNSPQGVAPGPLMNIPESLFYDHKNGNEENKTNSPLGPPSSGNVLEGSVIGL